MKLQKGEKTQLKTVQQLVQTGEQAFKASNTYLNSHNMQNEEEEKKNAKHDGFGDTKKLLRKPLNQAKQGRKGQAIETKKNIPALKGRAKNLRNAGSDIGRIPNGRMYAGDATQSPVSLKKNGKILEKGSEITKKNGMNAGIKLGTQAGMTAASSTATATTATATGGATLVVGAAKGVGDKFRTRLQESVGAKVEELQMLQSTAQSKMKNTKIDSLQSGVQVLGSTVTALAVPVMIMGMHTAMIAASVLLPILIFLAIVVMVITVLASIVALFFGEPQNNTGYATNVNLSSQVETYRPLVAKYAREQGIEEYVPYLLAIMQVESGGSGGDPMQSSESQGMPPNTITDPEVSIAAGVRHFANALRLSEAKGTDIYTSIQSYNFGTGYIGYVVRNGGKHTFEIAESFSKEKANGVMVRYSNPIAVAKNGGYRYRFGNMFYVELVNQYIQISSIGSGAVPIYLQGDPAWKSVPYAGTTIGYAGCGLVAAASCFAALTGEEITPLTLQQMVGSSCTIGGVNDMGKFAAFGKNRWDLSHTGVLSISRGNIGNMINQLDQGRFVFASMQGSYPGGVGYIANGHILLLYKDGDAYYMMDPAYRENSREWSMSDLGQINWKYCYGIWK